LVDGIFLSPVQAPGIASVPIEMEQLASELPNLSKTKLEQIAHPEILDSDQRELMALYCKTNHLSFPALIRLAESGRIRKRLTNLKERLPVCISCIFGMSHRSHGVPKVHPIRSEKKRDRTRRLHEHRSNCICSTRFDSPNGWFLDQYAHLGSYSICGSRLRLHLCRFNARSYP